MELSLDEIAEILKFIDTLDCAEVDIAVGDVRIAVRKRSAADADEPLAEARSSLSGPAKSAAPSAPAAEPAVAPATTSTPIIDRRPEAADPLAEFQAAIDAGQASVITAPMVGTVYRAKEPGAEPFVEIGQRVEAGDIVCLVEVMKLFHSVTAETAGVVQAVFFADGEAVEFMQPLAVVGAVAT